MAKENKSLVLAAVVTSTMHAGYRRAGIAFDKGENTVDINEEQLAQIEQDTNLLVQSAEQIEPSEPGKNNAPQGAVDDGVVGEPVAAKPAAKRTAKPATTAAN